MHKSFARKKGGRGMDRMQELSAALRALRPLIGEIPPPPRRRRRVPAALAAGCHRLTRKERSSASSPSSAASLAPQPTTSRPPPSYRRCRRPRRAKLKRVCEMFFFPAARVSESMAWLPRARGAGRVLSLRSSSERSVRAVLAGRGPRVSEIHVPGTVDAATVNPTVQRRGRWGGRRPVGDPARRPVPVATVYRT